MYALRQHFLSLDGGRHMVMAMVQATKPGQWVAAVIVEHCTDAADAEKVRDALMKDVKKIASVAAGREVEDSHFDAGFEERERTGWTAICCVGVFPSRDAAMLVIPPLHAYCVDLVTPAPVTH